MPTSLSLVAFCYLMEENMQRQNELRARCSPSELKALELLARQEQRKPTDVLRDLVIVEARKRGLWPPAPAREAVQDARTA